jgi:hypothetical protein
MRYDQNFKPRRGQMIPEKPTFNRFRARSGVFLQARWACPYGLAKHLVPNAHVFLHAQHRHQPEAALWPIGCIT